jgi:hypothetical protein
MNTRLVAALVLALSLCASCGTSSPRLEVQVIEDYLPVDAGADAGTPAAR